MLIRSITLHPDVLVDRMDDAVSRQERPFNGIIASALDKLLLRLGTLGTDSSKGICNKHWDDEV